MLQFSHFKTMRYHGNYSFGESFGEGRINKKVLSALSWPILLPLRVTSLTKGKVKYWTTLKNVTRQHAI